MRPAGFEAICGLRLLVLCSKRFFPGYSDFSISPKTSIFQFELILFDLLSPKSANRLDKPWFLIIVIIMIIIIIILIIIIIIIINIDDYNDVSTRTAALAFHQCGPS